MRLLQYRDLDLKRVKPAFAKLRSAIEGGDFKSPDVKKLHVGGYCRAKLDHSNRLLLQCARHGGVTVCLALEATRCRISPPCSWPWCWPAWKRQDSFCFVAIPTRFVHPNFFRWMAVKTLFWHGLAGQAAQHQQLQVLQANLRNTQAVTELANTLLKIKQARFGSIDRESHFLVQCTSGEPGEVMLVQVRDAALKQLDATTRASVRHALIVLRDEDKAHAKAQFKTPLVYSVHEAKGLEYPHVMLLSMVSGQRAAYAEVRDGVTAQDLQRIELDCRRARDKNDKSLELFRFYVNALYVAMTRAVESLTIVESDTGHPIFGLLGLQTGEARTGAAPALTKEEWAQEARKLELQGKDEQARAIRETILQGKPVPWTPWSRALIEKMAPKALDPANPSNKPRQTLFDCALPAAPVRRAWRRSSQPRGRHAAAAGRARWQPAAGAGLAGQGCPC